MTNGNDGIKAKKYAGGSGGYESAGNISNVQADGTTDNKEVTDAKDAKKAAYDMSQSKGSGNVKSIRENIADYLPDSGLRRRILSKAEKKRERLDAKFGKKEYSGGDPKILNNKKLIDEKDKRLEGLTNKEISSIIGKPVSENPQTGAPYDGMVDYDARRSQDKHGFMVRTAQDAMTPGFRYSPDGGAIYPGIHKELNEKIDKSQSAMRNLNFSDKQKFKNPFNK